MKKGTVTYLILILSAVFSLSLYGQAASPNKEEILRSTLVEEIHKGGAFVVDAEFSKNSLTNPNNEDVVVLLVKPPEKVKNRILRMEIPLEDFEKGIAENATIISGNRLFITLKDGVKMSSLRDIVPGEISLRKLNISEKRTEGKTYILAVLPVSESLGTIESSISAFKEFPDLVELVEPYVNLKAFSISPPSPVTPNDTCFAWQWSLNNTGQTYAWGFYSPPYSYAGTNDSDIDACEAWNIKTSASDVNIAIVDIEGFLYTHDEIDGNLWTISSPGTWTGVVDDSVTYDEGTYGIDLYTPDSNPIAESAPNDHGTRIAGMIGAEGNNNTAFAGVCWDAKMMPIRAGTYVGGGFTVDGLAGIEAIYYAVQKGADIINISWGAAVSELSQAQIAAFEDALDYARQNGVILVCAAGNSSTNLDSSNYYPAGYSSNSIIAVASTTDSDGLASTSSYGSTRVDIGAPGQNIRALLSTSDTSIDPYNWVLASGTSFAAPMVTGAVALVKSQYSGESYTSTINRVLNNVDEITALNGKCVTEGRLNLHRALSLFGLHDRISVSGFTRDVSWFGYIDDESYPYIEHEDIGALLIDTGTTTSESAIYAQADLFDGYFTSTWIYTTNSVYPRIYRYDDTTWVEVVSSDQYAITLYNWSTHQYEYYPPL